MSKIFWRTISNDLAFVDCAQEVEPSVSREAGAVSANYEHPVGHDSCAVVSCDGIVEAE